MDTKIIFYLILLLYFTVSWFIIRITVKKSPTDTIHEKIVSMIFRISLVFDISLLMLLVSLKRLITLFGFSGYETMKVIVTGVLALSVALSALSFMNFRFLKGLKRK